MSANKILPGVLMLLAATPALATTYAADAGFPERYRGEWGTDLKRCKDPGGPGYARVNIMILGFGDGVGTVRTVMPHGPDMVHATLDYVSGARRWSETNMLTLSAKGDRLTISGHGKTRTYLRCPTRNE